MGNNDKYLAEVRDRVFSLLESGDISQKEFATALGVSAQTITDWKKGKSHSYMQKLPLIAGILNGNLNWLCNGVGEQASSAEDESFGRLLKMAYESRFEKFDADQEGPGDKEKSETQSGSGLSDGEQLLISLFRMLSQEDKDAVLRIVQAAANGKRSPE